jgi:hypothetical protein
MPVGPPYPREDPNFQLPTLNSEQVIGTTDIALSTVFNNGQCTQITICTAGVIFLQGVDDTTAHKFTVIAGQVLKGRFRLIGGTTNFAASTAGLAFVVSN